MPANHQAMSPDTAIEKLDALLRGAPEFPHPVLGGTFKMQALKSGEHEAVLFKLSATGTYDFKVLDPIGDRVLVFVITKQGMQKVAMDPQERPVEAQFTPFLQRFSVGSKVSMDQIHKLTAKTEEYLGL